MQPSGETGFHCSMLYAYTVHYVTYQLFTGDFMIISNAINIQRKVGLLLCLFNLIEEYVAILIRDLV